MPRARDQSSVPPCPPPLSFPPFRVLLDGAARQRDRTKTLQRLQAAQVTEPLFCPSPPPPPPPAATSSIMPSALPFSPSLPFSSSRLHPRARPRPQLSAERVSASVETRSAVHLEVSKQSVAWEAERSALQASEANGLHSECCFPSVRMGFAFRDAGWQRAEGGPPLF